LFSNVEHRDAVDPGRSAGREDPGGVQVAAGERIVGVVVEGAVDLVLPEHPLVKGVLLVGANRPERDRRAVGQAREQHGMAVEVGPEELWSPDILAAGNALVGHKRALRASMASSREAPVATATMYVSPRATARQTPSQPGSR